MERKKILIVYGNMSVGGVQTSILNFINQVDCDVDLLLLNKMGLLLDLLPKNVNVIEGPECFRHIGSADTRPQKGFKKFIRRIVGKIQIIRDLYTKNLIKEMHKKLSNYEFNLPKYDLIISYDGFNAILNELVLKYLKADKKALIIHNDVFKVSLSNELEKQFFQFDYCCGCSKSCSDLFCKKYNKIPQQKIVTLYNFQDTNKFLEKAKEPCERIKTDDFCIGTVGRIADTQKAVFRTLRAIKKLNNKGYKFKYYWVGGGPDYQKVQKYINKNKLTNVSLLGVQSNPYKYIVQFDLFVLASYYEAAPMVYAEAMTLGVPVLTTNTCSAMELVGERGFVCDNTEDGIVSSLEYILKNKEILQEKRESLFNYKWDNENNRKTLIQMLNGD